MALTPKILIVDEDLDSRVETRRALQRAQLELAGEVGYGTTAVTAATETNPDLLLVAIEEPVTRALETVENLSNVLPDTPIIFYSSLKDSEAVRRGALYGARDYLIKPLQAATISKAVVRALEYEEKRQMRLAGQMADTPIRGTVIVVAGAKGGIGKSILAVNLALALRIRTLGRVVIIDADTHFGDMATMLDVTPEIGATQLLRDLDKVDRSKIGDYLVSIDQGLTLLAGPREDNDAWDVAGPASLHKIVDLLSVSNDFIVVDTSGAMDKYVRTLTDVATMVLMVTTGEVSSVRDTKAGLSRLRSWGVPDEKVKLVLNRGARADGFQVADLEKSLERPVFWEMPRDKEAGRSVQMGRPVVFDKPKSPLARNVVALAEAIGGNTRVSVAPARIKEGFFSRVRAGAPKKATS